MAQILGVLLAIVIAVEAQPQPAPILDNNELMEIILKPAYVELQQSVAKPPADRKAWAAIYQKAARLAEMENLLFFRSHENTRKPEWSASAARARQAAADVAAAALLGLRTVKPENYQSLRARYSAVADSCNACHRTFAREAPSIKP